MITLTADMYAMGYVLLVVLVLIALFSFMNHRDKVAKEREAMARSARLAEERRANAYRLNRQTNWHDSGRVWRG